jgi:dUTP pyrophosphatase
MLIKYSFIEPENDRRCIAPSRANLTDAGLDVYHVGEDQTIEPGITHILRTGLCFEIPNGYTLLVMDRSSQASKSLATSGGVIDPGYSGEIKIICTNIGKTPIDVKYGMKIAQLLLVPVVTFVPFRVDKSELYDNLPVELPIRGEKGFGSSGE